jgi:hypothetical protein
LTFGIGVLSKKLSRKCKVCEHRISGNHALLEGAHECVPTIPSFLVFRYRSPCDPVTSPHHGKSHRTALRVRNFTRFSTLLVRRRYNSADGTCSNSSHALPEFPPILSTFIARYQHTLLLRVADSGQQNNTCNYMDGSLLQPFKQKGVGIARVPARFNVGITWVRSYQSAVERHVTSLPPAQFHRPLASGREHYALSRPLHYNHAVSIHLNIGQCFYSTLLPFTVFVQENVRRDFLQSFTCTNLGQWRILVCRRQHQQLHNVRARSPGPQSYVFTSVRGLKYYLDEFQDSLHNAH